MKLNDTYDAEKRATVPGALALLVKAKPGSSISRPGGSTVRLSNGPAEHALHRYVCDDPIVGPLAFDATAEDLESDAWRLSGPPSAAKADDTAKASPQARR